MESLSDLFRNFITKLLITSGFKMCEHTRRTSVDLQTPRNVHLTAFYKRYCVMYMLKFELICIYNI